MIDVRAAREHPGIVRAAILRKSDGAARAFDELMDVDRSWRDARSQVDELRSRKSKSPKGRPTPEELEDLTRAKEELRLAEQQLRDLEERRDDLLAAVPNPPEPAAPDGSTDDDAVELRRVGTLRQWDFPIRDHVDLGEFDVERGARLSGSRFAYRMGATALVEMSLYRYALDVIVSHGFVPVLPPVLVREEAMRGTGFLPTDEVNIYRLEADDLYLTGTSEVALAGLHMGEMLEWDDLPLRYAG